MIEFTVETEIARPAAEVFAYATDPAKLATWQTNTVSAVPDHDGPLGLGTRVREVHRAPGGKQLASLVEVSDYEPNRSCSGRSNARSHATATRSNSCSTTAGPSHDRALGHATTSYDPNRPTATASRSIAGV